MRHPSARFAVPVLVALAGSTAAIAFDLGPEEFAMLEAEMREMSEPGEFEALVGSSARDERQKGFLTVK